MNDLDRSHDLTPEEVKACSMFSHLDERQVREMLESLKRFTVIAYLHFQKSQAHEDDLRSNA
jgi:hypothetical protein